MASTTRCPVEGTVLGHCSQSTHYSLLWSATVCVCVCVCACVYVVCVVCVCVCGVCVCLCGMCVRVYMCVHLIAFVYVLYVLHFEWKAFTLPPPLPS